MLVTGLHLYPVKSLGGAAVESAVVEPWGLAGDRRWALVDGAGEPVTARECHALLRLTATVVDDDTIRLLDRADGESILVDTPLGLGPVPVAFSRLGFAAPADADVSEWVSARVARTVRLVWLEDPTSRPISGARGGLPGESLSLADAGPLLLTSEASLAQLDAWMATEADEPDAPDLDPADLSDASVVEPPKGLDMRRFRPNLVIDGDEPFAEDAWPGVRVGDVHFRTTMVCDRCVMTTLDPDTLGGGKEPIRTLARHRRWDRSTWFGIRLVRVGGGTEIHVGDAVVPEPAAVPIG
ncbi:MAG: MOSC N-terminal beta barrel domain-containing protein [Lapillicoccus sp.]